MKNNKNIKVNYFEKKYETMDYGELKTLQAARLKETLKTVFTKNDFYKNKLNEAGIKHISDIDNIKNIGENVTKKIGNRKE